MFNHLVQHVTFVAHICVDTWLGGEKKCSLPWSCFACYLRITLLRCYYVTRRSTELVREVKNMAALGVELIPKISAQAVCRDARLASRDDSAQSAAALERPWETRQMKEIAKYCPLVVMTTVRQANMIDLGWSWHLPCHTV